MEQLENRIVLSLNPTGYEQEILEYVNRMRQNPQEEIDLILSEHDSEVTRALQFFNIDKDVLQAQFNQLTAVPPLAWNEALMDAAHSHSDLMLENESQLHQFLGEASLFDRVIANGYDWTGSVHISQNIFGYASNPLHAHAAFAIDWQPILEGDFNGNQKVDLDDLDLVLFNWNLSQVDIGPEWIFNRPELVGVEQLNAVLFSWSDEINHGNRNNIMHDDFRSIGIGVTEDVSQPNDNDVGPLLVTQNFGHRDNDNNPIILGVIFEDVNRNLNYDAGEGLPNITIELYNENGDVFTATTMLAGGYQVVVDPGIYNITANNNIEMGTIVVDTENVKVDLIIGN